MPRCSKGAWLLLTLSAALLLTAAAPVRAQNIKPAPGPDIDVVICLDVSSSMQGLFGSAKLKLWDIVIDLNKVKPTPTLRVALYSYGHRGYDKNAGWVRKEIDLTTDLDDVYRKLHGLKVNGDQEYVARVCNAAIREQKWSKEKNALRVLFVCGNEAASQDPMVKLKEVAALAVKQDIIINPIFCGSPEHPAAASWKEFAKLAKGRFASIDQNRAVTSQVITPNDPKIADLSRQLSMTYLPYGKEGPGKALNQREQDNNAARTSPGAAASRGVVKSGDLYRNDSWDLVDRLKMDPKFDVKKVPEAELSDELKKMTPEERERHVKKMFAERETLHKQILDLNLKRDDFLRAEFKKNPSKADRAFDEAIRGALREQAAARGIKFPD